MGLLQKAVETYEAHQALVGVIEEGKEPLAPVGFITTSADYEITINTKGAFVEARAVDKKEPKIMIPATEKSASRSGRDLEPHPFCEQLKYLLPQNKELYAKYIKQLSEWVDSSNSHPKLGPVLEYVKGGTILNDLDASNLLKYENDHTLRDKGLIRWRIIGLPDDCPSACWEDSSFFAAFSKYVNSANSEKEKKLCMINGEYTVPATLHQKGIVAIYGNAKLISSNDKNGFTYRGRFTDELQCASIGFEASQKAHNAIRWQYSRQKDAIFGGRAFLCWNPYGKKVPAPALPFMTEIEEPTITPSDYREALKRTLSGFQTELKAEDDVVIAAFDAATKGRLALVYYNELKGSDYLCRLYNWDSHCCWPNRLNSYAIESPSIFRIINIAFGVQRIEKEKAQFRTDDRLMKQQVHRLIRCRVDCMAMPKDIMVALLTKASNLIGIDTALWETVLFTACAVIHKYHYDRTEEDIPMTFDPQRKDRSYQFGALLAVMEKAERDTYRKDESREPNAIRLQNAFCHQPLKIAGILEKQLEKAYFPRLSTGLRAYYKRMITQIMEVITESGESINSPLKETYLLGYYLKRGELYKKNNKNNDAEQED